MQKCVVLGVILQNFPGGMPPDSPRMVIPSALPLKLIWWRHTIVTELYPPLGNFLPTPLLILH